jgi:hypothetical protein
MGTGMKVWLFLLSLAVMASLALQVATLDKLDYVRYLAHQAAESAAEASGDAHHVRLRLTRRGEWLDRAKPVE